MTIRRRRRSSSGWSRTNWTPSASSRADLTTAAVGTPGVAHRPQGTMARDPASERCRREPASHSHRSRRFRGPRYDIARNATWYDEMMLQRDSIRTIAIIAHVDHGKTTLVD